jgi:hypothetical protein
MATDPNIELDIQTARLNACAQRRVGNHMQAAAWDAEAEALTDRLVAMSRRNEWMILADGRRG